MANPLWCAMQKDGQWDSGDIKSNNRHDKALSSHQGRVGPAPKNCHSLVATANLKLVVFTKEGFKNFKESNWNMATSPSVQSGYYSSIH